LSLPIALVSSAARPLLYDASMLRLPPIRDDLTVEPAAESTLIIHDPLTGHRTHLGAQSAAVWRARRAGHDTPLGLCAAVSALPPAVVRDRLRQIRDALLLDDARFRAQAPLFAGGEAPPLESLPLILDPDLRHRCVRCGSSCLGVDIGPVSDRTLAAVEGHGLWRGTPDAESAAETVQRRITEHGPVRVFEHVHGACIMLRGGDRCAIHAAAGEAAKPAGCRQFPYTFTSTDAGIAVGLQFECRSLVASAAAGRAESVADRAAGLQRLVADGALVSRLPDPVTVAPGLFVPAARYLAWWAEAARVERLRDAVPSAVALAEARRAELGPEPGWLSQAAWPGEAPPGLDVAALRRALPHQIMGACAWLTRDAAGRRDMVEQEQAELVRKALLVQTGAVRLPPTVFDPGPAGAPDPWRIALRGALADHRAVLGIDLLQGLGRLAVWLDLARAVARLRAAQAARRPVRPDDVTDGLIITHRILRTGVVDQTLRAAHAAVRAELLTTDDPAPWLGVPAPGLLGGGDVTVA